MLSLKWRFLQTTKQVGVWKTFSIPHPSSFQFGKSDNLSDWKACREVSKIPTCSGVPGKLVFTPALHASKVWRSRVQNGQNMKMSRIFSFQLHITWEGPCHPENTLVSEQKSWLSRQSPCLAWLEKGSPAGLFVFLHFSALKTMIFLDISLREEVWTPHVHAHQTKKVLYQYQYRNDKLCRRTNPCPPSKWPFWNLRRLIASLHPESQWWIGSLI